jgi:2-deoxy-D-gluconate 3-dehydrogenase
MQESELRKLFGLDGKTFVVTGGNGGLGLAMATALAKCGADIAIAARDEVKGTEAISKLAAHGVRTQFFQTDVSERTSCQKMADDVRTHFGRIDGLIANAGIVTGGWPHTIPAEDWHRAMGVNLDGILFSAQAVYPMMKEAGAGKVLITGSMLSIFGCPNSIEYGASKGAAVQLAKGMAVAWAPDNIQVNAILPGFLHTDMVLESKRGTDDEWDEAVRRRTPAGR